MDSYAYSYNYNHKRMTYKGKIMRRDAVTCEMVAEYISEKGYDELSAKQVYGRLVSEQFYGEKSLEEAVDKFKHYSDCKKRRDEKKRIKAEQKAQRAEKFHREAYHVYTDGSCDNVHTKVGGSGYIILKDGNVVKMKNKGFYPTTNNRMELLAIISALNSLPEKSDAIVFTDSKYCIRVLDGYQHEKNQDLIGLFIKIRKPLGKVFFQWVKGHNGNEYNEMADELAFSAFKEMSEKLGKPVSKWMLKTH